MCQLQEFIPALQESILYATVLPGMYDSSTCAYASYSRENAPLEGKPLLLDCEVLEADAVGEHGRCRLRHRENAESADTGVISYDDHASRERRKERD